MIGQNNNAWRTEGSLFERLAATPNLRRVIYSNTARFAAIDEMDIRYDASEGKFMIHIKQVEHLSARHNNNRTAVFDMIEGKESRNFSQSKLDQLRARYANAATAEAISQEKDRKRLLERYIDPNMPHADKLEHCTFVFKGIPGKAMDDFFLLAQLYDETFSNAINAAKNEIETAAAKEAIFYTFTPLRQQQAQQREIQRTNQIASTPLTKQEEEEGKLGMKRKPA